MDTEQVKPRRYRVYLIGGSERQRFDERPVLSVLIDGVERPSEGQLDALTLIYGHENLLPVIEPDGCEMPQTVKDLLGSPAEGICPKHGRHISAACSHCALDEIVEISENLGLYD